MASNRITVDLSGRASIAQRILGTFFRGYQRRLEDAITEGSEEGTREVLMEWKREATDLAPLEKGTLRRNIKTELTEGNGEISGEISASVIEMRGGRRFDYAAYLHDVYPEKHGEKFKNPTTDGTIPRFIDQPLEDNAEKWAADIEREIESTLRRKGFRPRRR
ncbi:HK97 gp10 family phage protein [Paenibacillus sp. PL91]|uniref:HK97 gp10 family phage protein n=1 Tax=Paenibacillus sp. PL91 TaxID=2729538 RepID=UPI00145ED9B1|nr:HK97 gp10 family phage protein [Paenibacillus sp. PL91]MBC9199760.1 HK97 gp10 family phage protein [Paenibacillus sp. PL91]